MPAWSFCSDQKVGYAQEALPVVPSSSIAGICGVLPFLCSLAPLLAFLGEEFRTIGLEPSSPSPRMELLKLLLTCFSEAMYLPPSPDSNSPNPWVQFFCSTENR